MTDDALRIALAEASTWKWMRQVSDEGVIRNDLLDSRQRTIYEAHARAEQAERERDAMKDSYDCACQTEAAYRAELTRLRAATPDVEAIVREVKDQLGAFWYGGSFYNQSSWQMVQGKVIDIIRRHFANVPLPIEPIRADSSAEDAVDYQNELATLRTQVRDLANKANALEEQCATLRAQLDRAREGLQEMLTWPLLKVGSVDKYIRDLLAQLQPEQKGPVNEPCALTPKLDTSSSAQPSNSNANTRSASNAAPAKSEPSQDAACRDRLTLDEAAQDGGNYLRASEINPDILWREKRIPDNSDCWHNPANLTREQFGDGYRPLTVEEAKCVPEDSEVYCCRHYVPGLIWESAAETGGSANSLLPGWTYRIPLAKPAESDTPLTDAEEFVCVVHGASGTGIRAMHVCANFARDLERRLAQASHQIDSLRDPAVVRANILRGTIVLPDDYAESEKVICQLRADLATANERAEKAEADFRGLAAQLHDK